MNSNELSPKEDSIKFCLVHKGYNFNHLENITNYIVQDEPKADQIFSNEKEITKKNLYPSNKNEKKQPLVSISHDNIQVCHLENFHQKKQQENIFKVNDIKIENILGNLKLYPVTIKVEKVENSCSNIPYIKIKNCYKEKNNIDANRNINNFPIDKEKLINIFKQERGLIYRNINYNSFINDNIINGYSDGNCILNKGHLHYGLNKENNFDKINIENNNNSFFHLFSMDENQNNCKINNSSNIISNNNNKGEQKEQKTKKQLNVRLGDWACKQCNNLNFSFRDKCNRCGLDKEIVGYDINENNTLNRNLASLNIIGKNINNNKYNINYNNSQNSS